MHWKTSWPLIKDVVLTGTGLTLILLQTFSAHPSTEQLVTGLALTGLGASFHVGSLMGGQFGLRASPPPSSSSSGTPSKSDPGGDSK